MRHAILFIAILAVLVAGCKTATPQQTAPADPAQPPEVNSMASTTFQLTSPAFTDKGRIPSEYTCEGADTNPELRIDGIPRGTKSLALIVDDPDAPRGTWVHWVVWNIPLVSIIGADSVPEGAVQGLTSSEDNSYGGPCPPSGTHRYFFKLYALDTTLILPDGAAKEDLEIAMNGHVLGIAQLMGTYSLVNKNI